MGFVMPGVGAPDSEVGDTEDVGDGLVEGVGLGGGAAG